MRMLTRRKEGDTLPGSSATREERLAHNLVVSPIYKSVWAWFDSIPHCCKTSTVTAWWCNLEMEPKSLMQHLYCQETATESYIKCIMYTARVGNDDEPNIKIKHMKNPNLLGLKLYFWDRRDTAWHQTISKTSLCSLPHCFISSSSSSSCLQVCQNWENHLIKIVTNKEWRLGAKLCVILD